VGQLTDANSASRTTVHTEYGQIYNRPYFGRDRIMPATLNLAYMGTYGNYPNGYRQTLLFTPQNAQLSYGGPFAIADLPPLNRKLPWERTVK
jgi:hypothetical protein